MGTININGKIYEGSNISINGDQIIIDGVVRRSEVSGVVEVRILEGKVWNITSSASITCSDVEGDVQAGGSVTCSNVKGDVQAGGSVTTGGSIGGDVMAGGSVRMK